MKFRYRANIIFVLVCVVLFSNTVHAAESENVSFIEKTISEFEDGMDIIEDDFKQSFGYEDGNEEIYFDLKLERELQYKIYTVKNESVALSYRNTESFSDNISEEYLLNIPISNGDDDIVGVVSFYCYEDGVCTLYSFGKIDEEELTINETLKSLKDVDEKKAVILNKYNLLMIYYRVGEKEYIQQITESPYISLAQNENVLTANDDIEMTENASFIEIDNLISVIEEFEEENGADNGYGTNVLYSGAGNVQSKESNIIQTVSYVIMVTSLVIMVGVMLIFMYNKVIKKRKKA